MFNPCLLIPIYNHGLQLKDYLPQLLAHKLPIIMVNDGSNKETTDIISALEQSNDLITVLDLASNLGKGGAVAEGFVFAYSQGFTHALQIDADGQHDASDIPEFLRRAEERPEALIGGRPVYDESVPKARFYGRYITHVLVWIETLSFDIKDSMCGYRIYPLESTVNLVQKGRLGLRMDFDTSTIVRLYWRGVNVEFIETHVKYPNDGLSHFDLWRDNVNISKMHISLVIMMLLQLPKVFVNLLRGRKPFAYDASDNTLPPQKHWAQRREKGSLSGMKLMLLCYKLLGKRVAHFVLYFVIGFFFITAKQARTESQRFLQRVWATKKDESLPPSIAHSYFHLLSFGRALLDRLGVWSGEMNRDELQIHNQAMVDKVLLADKAGNTKGCIFFTSHLGNVDVMRGLLKRYPRLKLTVLMFTDNAQQINELMSMVSSESAMSIVPVNEITPATAMMLNERIERGECIAIAADRTPPALTEVKLAGAMKRANVVNAKFLDQTAAFPSGPFVLASLLGCPVYSLFCIYHKRKYHFYLSHFSDKIELPRRKRAELLPGVVQQYSNELAKFACLYPYQWFNFYNFWQAAPSPKNQLDE